MPSSKPWRTIVVRGAAGREPVDAAPVRVKRRKDIGARGPAPVADPVREEELPWRTVILGGDTGRFTWEQIDAAVRSAMAKREVREARARARRERDGVQSNPRKNAADAPRTGA